MSFSHAATCMESTLKHPCVWKDKPKFSPVSSWFSHRHHAEKHGAKFSLDVEYEQNH